VYRTGAWAWRAARSAGEAGQLAASGRRGRSKAPSISYMEGALLHSARHKGFVRGDTLANVAGPSGGSVPAPFGQGSAATFPLKQRRGTGAARVPEGHAGAGRRKTSQGQRGSGRRSRGSPHAVAVRRLPQSGAGHARLGPHEARSRPRFRRRCHGRCGYPLRWPVQRGQAVRRRGRGGRHGRTGHPGRRSCGSGEDAEGSRGDATSGCWAHARLPVRAIDGV